MFPSGAVDLGPTSRLLSVDFYFGDGVYEVSIAFSSVESPLVTATRDISALPVVKSKRGVVLHGYSLKVKDGGLVTSFTSIPPDPTTRLVFWQPERLTPLSASDWTSTQVEQLKINFTDVSNERDFFRDLPQLDFAACPAAQQLQTLLERVDETLLGKYEVDNSTGWTSACIREDVLLQHPICKALWAAKKYSNKESYVDDFVKHLLHELGFNAGMLYAAPQMSLPLVFGSVERSATADCTIMDVLSYCRICVFEDKRWAAMMLGTAVDSTGQVVAEGISVAQHNNMVGRKRDSGGSPKHDGAVEEVVYGIRVTGTVFHFYAMHVGDNILQAMNNQSSASESSEFYRYKSDAGLDFMVSAQRVEVIRMLSLLQVAAHSIGEKSMKKSVT